MKFSNVKYTTRRLESEYIHNLIFEINKSIRGTVHWWRVLTSMTATQSWTTM